jgi:hypothetical protein
MSHRLQLLVPIQTGEGGKSHLCSDDCRLLDKGGWLDPPVCRASSCVLAKLPSGEFQRTRFCLGEAK